MNITRLCACLVLFFQSLSAQEITFYGDAVDPDTNELLYQEVHKLTLDSQNIPLSEVVEYIDTNGATIGRKAMSYGDLTSPSYKAEYSLINLIETVDVTETLVKVTGKKDKNLSKPDSPFVIDGGFHYFIVSNLDKLTRMENVEFDFLSAGRATFFPMIIEPVSLVDDQLSLELTLDNFFLSKLIKPIYLDYSLSSKKLLSYSGLTNIPGANGKLMSARITYRYTDAYNLVRLNL